MDNPLRELSLEQLRRRTSAKWRAYPPDVLPLWIAEMDVPLAPPVVAAMTQAAENGDTGYTSGTAYAEALAAFATHRWDWKPEIAHTTVVPDVMLGVVEVLKLVTDLEDSVVVNPPVYPPFFRFITTLGRRVVEAPLGDDHRLDMGALESAFAGVVGAGRRAAFLLCSPHNPTGTVHSADELAAVAALAGRYGVRVVADEIHAPLVLAGASFVPFLSVPGAQDGFSLLSSTKGWNLAGLKGAVAVAGPGAAGDLARMPGEVGDGVSHVGVLAHTAALLHGGAWLDGLLRGLADNRRMLADLLAQHLPAIGYRPGSATYLAWLDCRELHLGDDPAGAFLARGRVALQSGPQFGTGGAGHARLNLATSPAIIEEAVRRMVAATR